MKASCMLSAYTATDKLLWILGSQLLLVTAHRPFALLESLRAH
jgi:hypothetical protein